jgi:flavin-dependent dehydrogenase
MAVREFDVVVVGAGPAGATAAILLRRKGLRVALVDQAGFPREDVRAGWLNARVAPLLAELNVTFDRLHDAAFRRVTFFNADFTKQIQPALEHAPGFLIDRCEFDNALVAAARTSGVSIVDRSIVKQLQLKESSVSTELESGRELEGRFLALTPGRSSRLLEKIGLARDPKSQPIWSSQVDAANPEGAIREPSIAVVLGLDRHGSFATCCVTPGRTAVCANLIGESGGVQEALARVSRLAFQHGVVPMDLSDAASRAAVLYSPASASLDMETHVAKHTLVFGDAGGFVAAASNEGIYPAMWSATIAAGVFERALQADLRGTPSQDELMRFDSEWRMQMAEYLRSPHTDIQFLLPLIFSNPSMANRMASAFFSGENI